MANFGQDFGPPVFISSKFSNDLLLHRILDDQYYLFRKTKSTQLAGGGVSHSYRCKGCEEKNARVVSGTVVRNGRVVRDPEVGHNNQCVPFTGIQIEAMKAKREMRDACLQGVRPIEAHKVSMGRATSRYRRNPEARLELAGLIGQYESNRSALYRHKSKQFIPVHDVNNLPIQYQITYDARQEFDPINPPDPISPEDRLLLHSGGDNFLIFCSMTQLQALHQSEYWVADGTFEKCPQHFKQLYTIHGFVNGEGVPLCHALMADKTLNSYERLFSQLRDALIARFQSVGRLHTILMDFEDAAHRAARNVFQNENITRGCAFHLAQCLLRKLGRLELKNTYLAGLRDPDGPNLESRFYRWVRMLQALSHIPPQLVMQLWEEVLQHPPRADQYMAHKFAQFRNYFDNEWMASYQKWNHHGNVWHHCERLRGRPGPRTTNHAEGWHNRLNYDFKHGAQPMPNTFLHWLQEAVHHTDMRIMQLMAGGVPRARDPRYLAVDRRIMAAKAGFVHHGPFVVAGAFNPQVKAYLLRISYLLGGIPFEEIAEARQGDGNA